MKVLFIGNSHTYFNDMPELFARMAEKTTGEKPEVTMLAYSGRELIWHRQEYFSVRFALMYGGYDFCVIQQAAHPCPPEDETLRYGGDICALCRKSGAKPVIFMTWAQKDKPENQRQLTGLCSRLAAENDALLAPIGEIWQRVVAKDPAIELYHTDGGHAGPYGDFLIAATLCKTLTGSVSPEVAGEGFDFTAGVEIDWETPAVCENRQAIPVALDRKVTESILEVVNNY